MTFPRVLTSLVAVPLVVAAIWFGTLPFFLLVLGVSTLCLWEYSLMATEGGYPNRLGIMMVGGIALLLAMYLDGMTLHGSLYRAPSPYFILLLWLFVLFMREVLARDKTYAMLRIMTTVLGVLLGTFCLGHLLLLRDLKIVEGEGMAVIGREIVLFLFIVVWTVDTGAWFGGRLIGRHPLAPRVSPAKTWEGALVGTVLACFMGWFLKEVFLPRALGSVEAVVYAFTIALTAQISDLTESLMKRSFGVKDASALLPGHGGFLDRFDSFIFSAPFFYYILLGTGRFQ